MTALSCKRYPGFLTQGGHGVKDSLVATTANKAGKRCVGSDFWQCKCVADKTRTCGSEMKPLSGFWNSVLSDPQTFAVSMQYRRHTGIDRETGTVAPTIFFISQAIEDSRPISNARSRDYEPQYLAGATFLADDHVRVLEQLFHSPVFAGTSRTRGFGELEISLSETDRTVLALSDWDTKFQRRLEQYSGEACTQGTYFSVKLDSHTILVDRFLRPRSELTLDFPDVELVKKSIGSSVIRGWNFGWGLPKPDDVGISMGSVFLFLYTGKDLEALERYLTELTVKGVGLRREEGFGRISVCEPLHVIEGVI